MSKRGLSPQNLPTSKRPHIIQIRPLHSPCSLDSLYDELVLTIFSYLSWVDLCAVQLINSNWARLAADNELWRKQYLLVYGRLRLRGSRAFLGRCDGREVKPLPARAQSDVPVCRDWKWMFRISSNWRNGSYPSILFTFCFLWIVLGRCSVEHSNHRHRLLSQQDSKLTNVYNSYLLLAGPLIITASSRPSYEPVIYISGTTESCSVVYKPRGTTYCNITAMAIDQSPPVFNHFRMVAFLSTGEFTSYQLQQHPVSVSAPLFSFVPSRRGLPLPVMQAVYHHPLLVTLSPDFTISLYNLEFDGVKLIQTLTSFTSFPPVSMILSAPSPGTYKLVLAYAIPVYPQHWTAGATELIISNPRMVVPSSCHPLPSDSPPSRETSSQSDVLTVLGTRTARAVDVPFGWIDERKLRVMREQWCRKVTRVADIQTDGKWVILAPGDQISGIENHLEALQGLTPNPSYPSPTSRTKRPDDIVNTFTAPSLHSPTNLQLYRLILPPQNSISSSLPRLSFVRTLHGQTGPIAALALSDGRCVSLGFNGSIWVWDLEAGTGAQVAAANLESVDGLALGPDAEPIRGSVSFDERRLIIAQCDNVVVRRFDV